MIVSDRGSDNRVFELTRDELDSLPYGVITLDRAGRILRYNYAEATFARRTTEGTIGLGFFTDVAPCTNVQAFKGRFDDFARRYDSGVDRFDFTFAFRWGSQDVSITLLRKAEHDEINLIVRGRSQAALDIAPLARNEPAAALAVGQTIIPPSSGIGARELDCDATWEIGSAEESAWRAKIHPDDVIPTRQIVNAALARHRPYGVEYRLLGANRHNASSKSTARLPAA